MSDLATYLAGLKAGDVVQIHEGDHVISGLVTETTQNKVAIGARKYRRQDDHGRLAGHLLAGQSQHRGPFSRILAPDEVADAMRSNTVIRAQATLRCAITLTTIPAMRAALDEAEAVLREAGE